MSNFKEIIKAHLDNMAAQDSAFAERYNDKSKSLDKCIEYITSEARKQAKNGCAAIEDEIVYGWAVHYYQEKFVMVEKGVKAKVVAQHTSKTTDIKPIKALVKDKKSNTDCVQLDLFGGF